MGTIATTAVFESGMIRPLEKLDLQERQKLYIWIVPVREESARQETLADVLGFDPADEENLALLAESQYQAAMQVAGVGHSGRSDVAESHDRYLYGDPRR